MFLTFVCVFFLIGCSRTDTLFISELIERVIKCAVGLETYEFCIFDDDAFEFESGCRYSGTLFSTTFDAATSTPASTANFYATGIRSFEMGGICFNSSGVLSPTTIPVDYRYRNVIETAVTSSVRMKRSTSEGQDLSYIDGNKRYKLLMQERDKHVSFEQFKQISNIFLQHYKSSLNSLDEEKIVLNGNNHVSTMLDTSHKHLPGANKNNNNCNNNCNNNNNNNGSNNNNDRKTGNMMKNIHADRRTVDFSSEFLLFTVLTLFFPWRCKKNASCCM